MHMLHTSYVRSDILTTDKIKAKNIHININIHIVFTTELKCNYISFSFQVNSSH